ncbi:hypothetical protein SmJEL517_g02002 [Synchytrium microbalum]|uniref:BHLH domain-containing protein n=1 Tax=Synchytrium microbalum TaxID=1806994 RepID=A0A507C823_9FUNG|nr:uncharacterized protein SmJEL517_g02002 [Synchytrium microbalum]TPX35762.1 hypothetical protein SmJEL517_g02002 [Synchytrium microbalum]
MLTNNLKTNPTVPFESDNYLPEGHILSEQERTFFGNFLDSLAGSPTSKTTQNSNELHPGPTSILSNHGHTHDRKEPPAHTTAASASARMYLPVEPCVSRSMTIPASPPRAYPSQLYYPPYSAAISSNTTLRQIEAQLAAQHHQQRRQSTSNEIITTAIDNNNNAAPTQPHVPLVSNAPSIPFQQQQQSQPKQVPPIGKAAKNNSCTPVTSSIIVPSQPPLQVAIPTVAESATPSVNHNTSSSPLPPPTTQSSSRRRSSTASTSRKRKASSTIEAPSTKKVAAAAIGTGDWPSPKDNEPSSSKSTKTSSNQREDDEDAPDDTNADSRSGGGASSSSRSRNAAKGLLSEEEKRNNHIESEKKRRQNIRTGFDQLLDLVPNVRRQPRLSEAEILQHALGYVKTLLQTKTDLKAKATRLRGHLRDVDSDSDDSSDDDALNLNLRRPQHQSGGSSSSS